MPPPPSAAAVANGGAADNWVTKDPACSTQKAACSVRFGGAFSYTIRTAAGRSYRLRFTFSEVWWEAAGQRVFDVMVDGAAVLTNVDPFALAGAKFTPVVREVTLAATGPTMVVSLQARADNAALAALEVRGPSTLQTLHESWNCRRQLLQKMQGACLRACHAHAVVLPCRCAVDVHAYTQ